MNRAWVAVAVAVLAVPASVSAGNLTIRGGAFFPSAEGANCSAPASGTVGRFPLFCDLKDLYTRVGYGDAQPPGIEKSDWVGVTGGLAYFTKIAPNVELGVSVDGYSRELDTSYRNYAREDGSEIFQTLRLRMVPIGLSLRLGPTSRRAKVAPYVEVGGDAISYKYEAFGDFIDFDDFDVVPDSFVSEGWGFGFHAAAGLKVPINPDFSIVGEGRYQWAKDDMPDDFPYNEIDLGGWSATIGFNIRF